VLLPENLAVCRLPPDAPLPDWLDTAGFFSLTRTADELSLVCPQQAVPAGVLCERGWRGLKVQGPLDFALVGVLSGLTAVLARASVSIFAISTYDTDYLLVKHTDLARAVAALRAAGYTVQD
jgi:hypothetical protein